jgi:NADH dehydrogenase FAD-containing subunit
VLLQVAYCTAAVAFEDGRRPQFEIEYDMVVVAVGEQPATFGVPGAYWCSSVDFHSSMQQDS